MKFEFSAGGIVYKQENDEFLFALILDSYNKWTFPKGKIEKKEKPEMAALREVGEELGIEDKLKVIKLVDKIDYWFKKDGELIHKFVYFYLMEASKETNLSYQKEEINDAQWIGEKEVIKLLGYRKDDLPLFKKALATLKKHPS
ncbi:MAG: NUDIX domain-containing protein [Patescibacteria group bacterium]